jgi:hypothetical protein
MNTSRIIYDKKIIVRNKKTYYSVKVCGCNYCSEKCFDNRMTPIYGEFCIERMCKFILGIVI